MLELPRARLGVQALLDGSRYAPPAVSNRSVLNPATIPVQIPQYRAD